MTKRRTCVVRKGSLTEDLYLQDDGTWGPYKTARRFYSERKAEQAAHTALGQDNHNWGLFP